jgi:8-oxo-dGTP pyrophosphatase MutT (NUDIX family)
MHSAEVSSHPYTSRVPGLTANGFRSRSQPPDSRFVPLAHLRKLSGCEQVAAVCYRLHENEIEFLLVKTRGNNVRWTFPKGSTEPGLTHAQAAALEAFEEAGVHGRIEETAFAGYARRSGRGATVNAHLCEVFRLSAPKEANRKRTWFSVQDAKRRLREGRENREGAQFARVLDRAVERIQQLRDAGVHRTKEHEDSAILNGLMPASGLQADALRRVKFDFQEAYGRIQPPVVMRLPELRSRETVPCEVLEFEAPKALKLSGLPPAKKALGTGSKNR